MREIDHFINGATLKGASGRFGDVFDPNTGDVQARVQLATETEVDRAVQAAQAAFVEWSAVNPQRRARVLFEFKRLVEADMENMARMLSSEHGKVIADAKGDIQRGLEVIEFACGIPHALKGEYTLGAGPGIDVYSMRVPLGVCAGITPFNFPAMIPMWMFGVSIAAGNTFVLKPSERDPSVPVRLGELMMEAGAPEGVLNVVHGDKVAVDAVLTHPLIKAVSFVGSSDIAHYVYSTGTAHAKRVQAFGGAKNHGIVLPDADMDMTVRDLVGAAYGSAFEEGAELVVDGREFTLQGSERGYFLGPTLLDRVTPDMRSYQEEIFGPVLQIVRADTFEEALALPTKHQYGNGVAIFTRDGRAARDFASRVEVGMVGINVPIPVPVAYHTFGGWERSGFGDINQHGMEGG